MTLRDKIDARTLTVGTWMSLGHSAIAEILARAGYDWIVIDLEHSVIDLAVAGEMIRVIDLCGAAPLVRLTSNDPDQVKRVMDAGAHGILVPMVNTAEEAARAVAATRYAPKGSRGVGLARAQCYGAANGFEEYFKWQDAGPVVIVQIEHTDAIGRLDDILAVDGVDGLIIGPYDLSCSMGIAGRFEEPQFVDAMDRILQAARRCRAVVGIHIVEPDVTQLARRIDEGYTFVAYSVDFRMLDASARQGAAYSKKERA